jgi:hypothetical protein
MTDNECLQEDFLSENDKNKINMVLRQTNYTYIVARQKLIEHNFNEINVIKEYLSHDNSVKIKPTKILSINQQIYNEIRSHLNKPNNIDNYLSYK